MNLKHLFLALITTLFFCCKQQSYRLSKIDGKNLEITDSLDTNEEIDSFIMPFRQHLQKKLDSVIAYSKATYTKTDGPLNTALGNFFADAVFEKANPVFKKRTGKDIDMVLLNHGGIRHVISKGDVTLRTAYELMPFENRTVVATLKGSQINEMITYLIEEKKAHPISKLNISVDTNFHLIEATINGKPIDTAKTYYVTTNDYLANGGDGMTFFKPSDSIHILNYKVRNILIDAFKDMDTLDLKADGRFIQKTH